MNILITQLKETYKITKAIPQKFNSQKNYKFLI